MGIVESLIKTIESDEDITAMDILKKLKSIPSDFERLQQALVNDDCWNDEDYCNDHEERLVDLNNLKKCKTIPELIKWMHKQSWSMYECLVKLGDLEITITAEIVDTIANELNWEDI